MDKLVTQENICQQDFRALMRVCFHESKCFSLTRFGGHAKPDFSRIPVSAMPKIQEALDTQDAVLESLSGFRVTTIETTRWFYTSTRPFLYVDLYEATHNSLQALLSCCDNLFFQRQPYMSMYPADLCFFQDDRLWFGSCSHEDVCMAFVSNDNLSSDLQKCGKWTLTKMATDMDNRQFYLSDFVAT